MHETLEDLHENLEKVISQVRSAIPNDEPFGTAHGNWSFPGLTRAELIEEAQSIADLIESQGGDDLGECSLLENLCQSVVENSMV